MWFVNILLTGTQTLNKAFQINIKITRKDCTTTEYMRKVMKWDWQKVNAVKDDAESGIVNDWSTVFPGVWTKLDQPWI